ncbi:unnamed protein product [Linum tenue]|uniref:Uncharacterized protein n=1 Tax=Linum tenue TaxID=586396 RepID=A0AAV0J948_9ROSI|nr:unnamed protein product [Linum tenue]
MVPSPALPAPCFPDSLKWILENQRKDGSWGLAAQTRPLSLTKDALSSTLASVLALKRWGVGDRHVQNALEFMERNSAALSDSTQQTPIGFDITFPAMIQTSVKDYNLNLPLKSAQIDAMLRDRATALNTSANPRSQGRDAYLAYISEGIGSSQDWETAMKFQRQNGSLFNSPSATAAAFIHLHDPDSLRYLRSAADENTAVPVIYPHGIHAQLCLVDAVEGLGIDCHFAEEIKLALAHIYRSWQQGEEDIFLDPTTCAMAFRILRLHGYPVSADAFHRFGEERFWSDTLEGYLKDERAVLELHKASKLIFPRESIMEHQQAWTRQFLAKLVEKDESDNRVRNVLSYPFRSDLEPVARKRNIEQFRTESSRLLKSSFSCTNFAGNDLAKLAVEDFNSLQSSHRRELQHLMLWLEEKGLDEMRLAKVRMGYCYFSAVATFSDADHSDARVLFSKHALLVSLVDDLFDMFGTHEEILNLVHLFERWDVNGPTSSQFSSELVETLYWAIHSTICENVEKAFPTQGRSVMNHIVELWVEMLKGMLKEAEWSKTNTIPTLEEYSTNATITLGVGAFLVPALYLAGQKLSEEVVKGLKFQKLFRETSNCGRLLNDSRGYEREAAEGKPNAVLLRMKQGKGGNGAEEEAMEEVERSIENLTRQVLEMALDENDYGQVPSEIRDMFWKSIQVFYLFYMKEDLYHASTKLVNVVESVINEPISLHENLG